MLIVPTIRPLTIKNNEDILFEFLFGNDNYHRMHLKIYDDDEFT